MPKKVQKSGARTEEEKLFYLQQRAQAEEELAKKKEEILALFLKDKLQKEQRNSAMNLMKLNEGWRTILRQTRAAELRKDIAVLSQTFERQLDGLDSVIKTLEHNLQDAERQSSQVRRVHLQHLERLWAQHDKRIKFLQQQWENGLRYLSSTFSSEKKQMLAHTQQQRADLDGAAFTVEQQHKEMMNTIHTLYRESIAANESAYEDRKATLLLQDKGGLKMTFKNQQTGQVFNRDESELDNLVLKNKHYMQTVETATERVKQLQDSIIRVKMRLKSRKTDNEKAEQDMTDAKNELNRKTQKLRDQLAQGQTKARKLMTDLTVHSNNATKKLQKVIDTGERVLRIAEMCRKIESKQKNVFMTSAEDSRRPERSVTEKEELEKEQADLQEVMQRMNTALLHREALKKRRRDLSQENEQLRLLLRQHLDAMTVSDITHDRPNTLLTVRKAPTSAALSDTKRHHIVIEAAHAAKHSL